MCEEFKNEFTKQLKAKNILYRVIRIEQPDNNLVIYSTKAKTWIGGDFHYGVKVGDKVYDNLTTEGISYRDWLIDLGYRWPDGPRRVK